MTREVLGSPSVHAGSATSTHVDEAVSVESAGPADGWFATGARGVPASAAASWLPDGLESDPDQGVRRANLSLSAGDARRWRRDHRALLVAVDLLALELAAGVGLLLGPSAPRTAVVAGVVVAWVLTLGVFGAYDLRHVGSGTVEVLKVIGASMRLALAVAVLAYIARSDTARSVVLVILPVGTGLLLVSRMCARAAVASARRKGHGQHRVLAVGTVVDVLHLIAESRRNLGAGFHVVGACVPHYDGAERRDEGSRRTSVGEPTHGQSAGDRRAQRDRRGDPRQLFDAGVPIVGAPHDVLIAASGSQADTVVVAGQGLLSRHALRRLAWQFEGTGVEIYFASSLSDVATPRITLRPLGSLPLLHVQPPAFVGAQRVLKGVSDRLLAAALVLLFAPVLIVAAALVRLDSPGPALYHQERIGRGSKTFRCLKFRTMRVGADREVDDLRTQSESDGVLFKIRADPRVTRVGRVLRRYSIDELPQLLNVLGGSMSLVGPRPPLSSEVMEYGHDVQRRLLVKPGMTGLWQVSGRSDLTWAESVRLDLYYVENWTPYFDLQLMARTVGAVVAGHGAY